MEAEDLLDKFAQDEGFGNWETVVLNCHHSVIISVAIAAVNHALRQPLVVWRSERFNAPQRGSGMESVFYGFENENIMNIEFMCGLLANYSKELSEAETYREKGDVQLKHAKLILDKVKNCSIPAVVGQSEQLVCDHMDSLNAGHPICDNCSKWLV